MSLRYRSTLPHYPAAAELSPAQSRAVAEATLGAIDWTDDVSGFCPCPGSAAHTNPTSPRDCRISLDTVGGHAPTLHCFHASCRTAVELANHQLRSALGRATVGQSPRPHAVRTTPPPASAPVVVSADLGPDHGLPLLLRTCFAADDIVSLAPGVIAEGETRAVPEHGGVNVLTRDQWLARLETSGGINRLFGGKDGLYLRINPVVRKSTGSDKDVTCFRHSLIESDSLSKPEQERLLRASGLPIAALIDSGGNSIHAWVRVEASTAAEFHERRELLWKSVPELQLDPQNRNPSRFSRCPGGRRGEGFQRLLAVNVGPASFAAWSSAQVECEGLIRASDFCAEDEPDPPQLIEGILFQGAKMIIAGPSKSRKTWNLTDLAIAVSLGAPWCGYLRRQLPPQGARPSLRQPPPSPPTPRSTDRRQRTPQKTSLATNRPSQDRWASRFTPPLHHARPNPRRTHSTRCLGRSRQHRGSSRTPLLERPLWRKFYPRSGAPWPERPTELRLRYSPRRDCSRLSRRRTLSRAWPASSQYGKRFRSRGRFNGAFPPLD